MKWILRFVFIFYLHNILHFTKYFTNILQYLHNILQILQEIQCLHYKVKKLSSVEVFEIS